MNLRPLPLAAAAPLLFLASAAFADPTLSAALRPERDVHYIGERIDLDLRLDLDGEEPVNGSLAPSGLPDHEETVRFGRLEPIRTAGPGVLAWTASLDLRGVGEIPFAPALQGTLRRIRDRSGFLIRYEDKISGKCFIIAEIRLYEQHLVCYGSEFDSRYRKDSTCHIDAYSRHRRINGKIGKCR